MANKETDMLDKCFVIKQILDASGKSELEDLSQKTKQSFSLSHPFL